MTGAATVCCTCGRRTRRPDPRRELDQRVIEAIRGEPMSEGRIAAMLGVHRISVRAALERLRRAGLADVVGEQRILMTSVPLWQARDGSGGAM